jgi:hypothetical protein
MRGVGSWAQSQMHLEDPPKTTSSLFMTWVGGRNPRAVASWPAHKNSFACLTPCLLYVCILPCKVSQRKIKWNEHTAVRLDRSMMVNHGFAQGTVTRKIERSGWPEGKVLFARNVGRYLLGNMLRVMRRQVQGWLFKGTHSHPEVYTNAQTRFST